MILSRTGLLFVVCGLLVGVLGCSDAPEKTQTNNKSNNQTNNNANHANNDNNIFEPSDECLSDEDYFYQKLWVPTISVQCVGCHNGDGVAGSTGLTFVLDDSADGVAKNMSVAAKIAKKQANGLSVLLRKPSGQHVDGHAGGKLIDPQSNTYRQFATFVARVNGSAGECDMPKAPQCDPARPWPGVQRVRRLSHHEYDQTLSQLLGQQIHLGEKMAADRVVNGFHNHAASLVASPLLVEQWLAAAESLSQAYVAQLSNHLNCASQANEACAEQFVNGFGQRAFRRPLTQDDRNRYMTLYRQVAAIDGFEVAITDVMTAMLISPHFLYRTEIGQKQGDGTFVLTQHEVASQLSYLLWGAMPDDTLLQAADRGELSSAEQIGAQAKRMLKDPRSAKHFGHFVDQWLELERFDQSVKADDTYPGFTPEIRELMKQETRLFLSHIFNEGQGTLPELFASKITFLNPTLKTFYGESVGLQGDQMQSVTLDHRPGILSRGSILATHSLTSSTSPVKRGLLVRTRLLCQHLPPPPPGLDASLPDFEAGMTTRQRFAKHSESIQCAGCHRLVDPIGFAFETFDGVGRFATMDQGKPVDAVGEILNTFHTNGQFDGLAQLTATLANSQDVHQCFSRQVVRFGFGISDTDPMACTMNTVYDAFVTGGLSMEALIVALISAPHFTVRVAEGSSLDQWYGTSPDMGSDMGTDMSDMSTDMPAEMTSDDMNPTMDMTPTEGITVNPVVQDDWGQGYCMNVEVTNTGSAQVQWRVSQMIGTDKITTSWNSVRSADTGTVWFVGESYNNTLGANEKTSFGYCAQR